MPGNGAEKIELCEICEFTKSKEEAPGGGVRVKSVQRP